MSRSQIIGWAITLIGGVIYAYGYFLPGHPPLLAWADWAPAWISGFFPNLETEVGTALMCVGSIPASLPATPNNGRN